MLHVRLINPECCPSEGARYVSREVCFTPIFLWLIEDEAGGLRAADGCMLTAAPFPSGDGADAARRLVELEGEAFVRRYQHGGSQYMPICRRKLYQKINKLIVLRFAESRKGTPIFCEPNPGLPGNLPLRSGMDCAEKKSVCAVTMGSAASDAAGNEEAATNSVGGRSARPESRQGFWHAQDACRATWQAYAAAFTQRYGTAPVRNARINSQIRQFVELLGKEVAPTVAGFFVQQNSIDYFRGGHSVGQMLGDAESLLTEWLMKRQPSRDDCRWRSGLRESARTFAATTRLADIVKDDGTPRSIFGDQDGIVKDVACFLG